MTTADRDPRLIGRRTFLAAAGVFLAGCTVAPSIATRTPNPRLSASPVPDATPRAAPATPLATPTPTGTPIDEVIARFTGRQPTQWGHDLPGIVRESGTGGVALTFDACGGPGGSAYDNDLIDLLIRLNVPATLFLNMRWIQANRALASDLAANPLFEIGNHGSRHCPLSVTGRAAYGIPGTSSVTQACHEVGDNHALIGEVTGRAPRFFRAGTAHYDDVGVACCLALGEAPVGFSINGDAGATFTSAQIQQEVSRVSAGAIVISHMNQPAGQTGEGYAAVLPRLIDSGVTFTHLA